MEFLTNDKLTIVGAAGMIGSNMAQTALMMRLTPNICLYDPYAPALEGVAEELYHCAFEGVNITWTSDVKEALSGAAYVVSSGGAARKAGMTREDLLGVNSGIMSSVIDEAIKYSPDAIYICVTNPLDVMTYLAYQKSGLPSNRLMGMGGVLDSARLSFAVCEKLGCDPADVVAWALGAHGEGMVCWPRYTTVAGRPITELMSEEEVAEVVQRCVKGGAEVVAHLKTGSAYYAPGASIAKMVEAILTDSHEVMSVCSYIDGPYGLHDLYMNIPTRLGKNGVEEIVEFDLTEDEMAALQESAASVKKGLENLPA